MTWYLYYPGCEHWFGAVSTLDFVSDDTRIVFLRGMIESVPVVRDLC
jgi:hypothetical protein